MHLIFSLFLIGINLLKLKLDFHKYHGTGNDFILVDNRSNQFKPEEKMIAWLCHRRFGIGADGLITLDNASGFDFRMKYYNADGKESSMCGNGGRCIVAFADFLSYHQPVFRFIAADGEHSGTVLSKEDDHYLVRLSMNDVTDYRKVEGDFIINTGSPHLVRFVGDVAGVDVLKDGRFIRRQDEFQPGGINVNFAEDQGGRIFVRTYERGVEDETLSCGTGVTASGLAYAVTKNLPDGMVPVVTRGGSLSLHFKRKAGGFTAIFLEGPAEKVYHGTIDIKRSLLV